MWHRQAPSNSLFGFVLINFTESANSLGMPDQPTKHDNGRGVIGGLQGLMNARFAGSTVSCLVGDGCGGGGGEYPGKW